MTLKPYKFVLLGGLSQAYWLFLTILQVVLSCIEGSPAARAGIHEGDELIEIDGGLKKQTILNFDGSVLQPAYQLLKYPFFGKYLIHSIWSFQGKSSMVLTVKQQLKNFEVVLERVLQ